jgi:hypothetical protein
MIKDIPPGLAHTVRDILKQSTEKFLEQKADEQARLAAIREGKAHTVPTTDKEKKLAALAEPKDKITHADVMVGRGVKREEVEELDELSKDTLTNYKDRATKVAKQLKWAAHYNSGDDWEAADKSYDKHLKRMKGVKAATARLAKEEVEEIDEAGNKMFPGTPEYEKKFGKVPQEMKAGEKKKTSQGEMKKTEKGVQHTRAYEEAEATEANVEEETDTPGNSTHQCAVHVKHATFGEGKTLFSQHAEPDWNANGYISWYDVMFEEGIKRVETTDLDILVSESHMSHKKKK